MTATYGRWRRLWLRLRTMCWACDGRGWREAAGEPYTREELRTRPELAREYAEILVNGGWAAPAVRRPCGKCGGTGRRK